VTEKSRVNVVTYRFHYRRCANLIADRLLIVPPGR